MPLLLPLLVLCAAPADALAADGRTILAQRCVRCHNAEKSRGGLDLSTRESALAGGATRDAIVPGDLEQSFAFQRAKDHSMPPPKDAPPLSAAEVDLLAAWITQGAPWSSPQSKTSGRVHERQRNAPGAAIPKGCISLPLMHPTRSPQSATCTAVDSKTRRVRRWRRHGNVASPLPQIALRPARR
jgi:mono/diheme cytochrome c family protein